MPILRAKRIENPLERLAFAYGLEERTPIQGTFVPTYGFECYKEGKSCDYHYHDSDEYWIIVDGQAEVILDGETFVVGPGDGVFTPMGVKHQVTALTEMKIIWMHDELQGLKRPGHLHDDDTPPEK